LKLAAGFRVIFPRIFAVENDGDDGVASAIEHGASGIFNAVEQVLRGVGWRHTRIDEADQIGNSVIAKHHVHRGRTLFVAVNVVEFFREMRGQAAIAVASEEQPCSAAEDALVGRHPLNAETVGNRQYFFGDASFRRPDALRANSKNTLMKI
jgi:hypothetical protein